MAVFRFLAAVFLLVAAVALVDDATPALVGAAPFTSTSLAERWTEIAPASLAAAKQSVMRATAPWVWDYVISAIIDRPTYLVFGLLALASGYLGRRRRTIEVFVN